MDPVKLMKQEVGRAAAAQVQSGTVLGLGTGSTTAFAIQFIGDRLKSGELSRHQRGAHLLPGVGAG
jgi:ribose 5-phosphate isomerase A